MKLVDRIKMVFVQVEIDNRNKVGNKCLFPIVGNICEKIIARTDSWAGAKPWKKNWGVKNINEIDKSIKY